MIRRLHGMNASLAFTSYQSGLLYMLGSNAQGKAQLHQSGMPKPMGLCADGNGRLVLSAGAQIMRLENVLEPDQRINQTYDACFMPRTNFVTGQLDAHDVGVMETSSSLTRATIVSRKPHSGIPSNQFGSLSLSAISLMRIAVT